MGNIIETIIAWFVGDKMDDVHRRSATAFWVVMAAMVGSVFLFIALVGE